MIRTTWTILSSDDGARVQAIGQAIVDRMPALIASTHITTRRVELTTRHPETAAITRVVVAFDDDDQAEDIVCALIDARARARGEDVA